MQNKQDLKKEEIKQLLNQFQSNVWLFPSTWGQTVAITEDRSFKVCFSDERNYSSIRYETQEGAVEFTIKFERDVITSISANANLDLIDKVDLDFLLNVLKEILEYYQNVPSKDIAEKRARIKANKNTIKQLQKEIERDLEFIKKAVK